MKTVFKKSLFALMFLFALSMLPMFCHTVHAGNWIEIPGSGGKRVGGEGTGGPCSQKTGFYVSVTWADSPNGAPHQEGVGGVLESQKAASVGYSVPAFAVNTESKVANGAFSHWGTAPWTYPAFDGSVGAGYGRAVVAWLDAEDPATGNDRGIDLAQTVCHVPATRLQQLINDGKSVFLNVEPICWCNIFTGPSAKDKTLNKMVGLTYGIGHLAPYRKTFTWPLTQNAFPRSFFYDSTGAYQGISDNVDPGPGHLFSPGEMMDKHQSWGICSLLLNQAYQVVICCEDPNLPGGWATEYMGSGPTYYIQPVYHGYTYVESTFSKEKTTLTDPHASYSAVCGGHPLTHSGTPGMLNKFNEPMTTPPEEALFIHYIGSPPPPHPTEAELLSWESAYLMPRMVAKREDGHVVDNAYILQEHIQEKIDEIDSKSKNCPFCSEATCDHLKGKNVSGDAKIDKVTCRGDENWSEQYYGVRITAPFITGTHGKNAVWNLYRADADLTGESWDTWRSGKAIDDV